QTCALPVLAVFGKRAQQRGREPEGFERHGSAPVVGTPPGRSSGGDATLEAFVGKRAASVGRRQGLPSRGGLYGKTPDCAMTFYTRRSTGGRVESADAGRARRPAHPNAPEPP